MHWGVLEAMNYWVPETKTWDRSFVKCIRIGLYSALKYA